MRTIRPINADVGGSGGPFRWQILESVLQQALGGHRQVVFITGEAGIGKTTFVQMATERMKQHGMGVLHCGCNELFGTHEAFLPLIEALHEQCRGADGASLLKSLREHAPTWLAQMPDFLARRGSRRIPP